MRRSLRFFALAVVAAALLSSGFTASAATTKPKPIEIKGEIIDTWCYLSGVMGGPEATSGSAHHTCALWCAAGGIPVGMRAEDGTVYMILKIKGEDPLEKSDTIMEIQSNVITARGHHYVRDGVNYLVVEKVVGNDGITNHNHTDYGPVPPFAIPEKK